MTSEYTQRGYCTSLSQCIAAVSSVGTMLFT